MSPNRLRILCVFLISVLIPSISVFAQNVHKNDSAVHKLYLNEFQLYEHIDFTLADKAAASAVDYFEAQGNEKYLVFWYTTIGDLYKAHNRYKKALYFYQQAYFYAVKQGNSPAYFLQKTGDVFFLINDYGKAISFYYKALEYYRYDKDYKYKNIADAFLSAGIIFERQKKFTEAKAAYKHALKVLEPFPLSEQHVRCYITLGIYFDEANSPDSALLWYNTGLNKSLQLPEKPYYSALLKYKAKSLFRTGYKEEAFIVLDTALNYAQNNHPVSLASIYRAKAEIYLSDRQFEKAKNAAVSGIFHAREQNLSFELRELYHVAAQAYHALGTNSTAYDMLLKENELLRKDLKPSELNYYTSVDKLTPDNTQAYIAKNSYESKIRRTRLISALAAFVIISFLLLWFLRGRKRLSRLNKMLKNSLNTVSDDRYKVREVNIKLNELNRKISAQAVLGEILKDSVEIGFSINNFMEKSLLLILSTAWFDQHKTGFIVLFGSDKAEIAAQQQINTERFSNYLHTYKENADEFHPLHVNKISICNNKHLKELTETDSDQACIMVPLINRGVSLGTIGLVLNHGAEKEEKTYSEFLSSVSSGLASVISRERNQKEKDKQQKEQEVLNQQLFAQNLELEQKNIKIEKVTGELKEKNIKIEKVNQNITAGIEYAKYIQSALLPAKEQIESILKDYFIMFRPKDVVSGDFYFVKQVKEFVVMAVGDCTGHGVAGALLSALSISILNDGTKRPETYTPDYILELLRGKIKNTFKQFGSENHNGLDISLCVYDTNTGLLQYAGAFSPLVLVRKGELFEYKATRNPIGFYPVEKRFENNEIQVQKGDAVYMFSDGYYDQIGGVPRKKYSKKAFKQNLLEIAEFNMPEQKQILEEIFDNRRGDATQVDDVTVMGVRIT